MGTPNAVGVGHHSGCRRLGDQNKHTCQEVTGIRELFEAWLLSTKWKWYPHKRRHCRWKLSQELKWPGIKYKHVKIKPRICVLFILCMTWTVNANSLKQNIIVIKEICSWLPTFCKQNLLLFIQPRWQHLILFIAGRKITSSYSLILCLVCRL